jgi:hypothetical protein
MRIDNQWERIIYIENLPNEWDTQKLKQLLMGIIEKNKGKILNPHIDVFIPKNESN